MASNDWPGTAKDYARRADDCTSHHDACDCRMWDMLRRAEAAENRVAELEEMLASLCDTVEQMAGYDPFTGLCPNGKSKSTMQNEQSRVATKARAALRGEGEGDA